MSLWQVRHLSGLGRNPFWSGSATAFLVEGLPTFLEAGLLLWRDRPVRAALAQEGEAETIGFVGGVDDGGHVIQATLASVEVGVADGRAVARGMIADLVEGVAESWLAPLGDLAQAFGVAGFVGDQVEASQGPDLTACAEAVSRDDGGLIASREEEPNAGHRVEKAGSGVRDMSFDLGLEGGETVTEQDVGLVVGLEALGVDGGQGWGRQGSLAEHGQDGVDGFGASATDLATEKGVQSIGAQGQGLMRIGDVQE